MAFRRHRRLRAEYVDCAHSGTRTWYELAEIFTRGHRLKRSAGLIAIDWLESVPIIGKIAQAVVRTLVAMRTGHVDPGKLRRGRAPAAHATALSAVRLLLDVEPLEPRLVIMDSFDRGDSEDLAGASALVQRLDETRTLFLAAVRTIDGRIPGPVEDLLLEAERLGRAERVELPPLDRAAIREAVEQATRSSVPDDWSRWLETECQGNPGKLWSLLGALQETGALTKSGRGCSWHGSPEVRTPSGQASAPSRDWDLDEDDRRLLALAACEGPVFHSVILAELAGLTELDVEDRLSRLCRLGLLEFRDTPTVGDDITSRYGFRHGQDARHFVDCLPAAERDQLRARLDEIRTRLGP